MSGTEWPSDIRIAELREQGLVPYSRYATASFVALSILVLLYILRSDLSQLAVNIKFLWQEDLSETGVTLERLAEISDLSLKLVILPPLVAVSAAFVATFLQTRFLFTPARLGIDTSRITPFAEKDRPGGFLNALIFLMASLFGLLVGISLLYLKLPSVLELLNNDYSYFVSWPALFFPWLLPFLLLVLFFTGMLYFFIERGIFFYRHRMSRKELLEESARNN